LVLGNQNFIVRWEILTEEEFIERYKKATVDMLMAIEDVFTYIKIESLNVDHNSKDSVLGFSENVFQISEKTKNRIRAFVDILNND
jgi:hypothetical protein